MLNCNLNIKFISMGCDGYHTQMLHIYNSNLNGGAYKIEIIPSFFVNILIALTHIDNDDKKWHYNILPIGCKYMCDVRGAIRFHIIECECVNDIALLDALCVFVLCHMSNSSIVIFKNQNIAHSSAITFHKWQTVRKKLGQVNMYTIWIKWKMANQ